MWIAIIMIGLLILLMVLRTFIPWAFIDGDAYNVRGKNKYGETKQERSARFDKWIEEYTKLLNKR